MGAENAFYRKLVTQAIFEMLSVQFGVDLPLDTLP